MSVKTPIRTVFDGSNNATGLAEFQSGEFIGLTHGGLGASLSIGTVGQVLKVNSGGTALEFGNLSSTLTIRDDSSTTDIVTIGTDILSFAGGTGITSVITDNTVIFAIDNTVVTASTNNTFTNKTFDANGTGNSISNIEVADFASGVIDTDISTVSASDDTLASAKAIKAYVDSQVTAQDLDFQGDSGGALAIDLDSETLTIAGGTGIDTSGSGNTLTVAIDNTVATLTGSQELTNKTLTSPVISSISNTGTLTLPTSTDTLVGRATTDTLTNKTLTSAVLNTGVSGTAILDEDNMASNSATQLATQQSIKAYVDANAGGGISWQTGVVADGSTVTAAAAGEGYFIDTTSATHTLQLPSSPTIGDEISIVDVAGTFDTNSLTVDRNGKPIQGSAADLTVSVERAAFTLVFYNDTQGWVLKQK